MWWLCYRDEDKPVGVAIIEAPSLYHARMQAAIRWIGRVADYSEGNEIDAERAALVPQEYIGRLLSPDEAQREARNAERQLAEEHRTKQRPAYRLRFGLKVTQAGVKTLCPN